MVEMAAATAAIKLGSAVMAAVVALRVSANDVFGCDWLEWEDTCRPENFDWL